MENLSSLLQSITSYLASVDSPDEFESEEREILNTLVSELSSQMVRLGMHPAPQEPEEGASLLCKEEGGRWRESELENDYEQIMQRALECLECVQYEEARAILEKAVEAFPDDAELVNHLALTCWELGDMERAADLYLRAMGLSCPDNFSVSDWLESVDHPFLRATEGRALSLYQLKDYEGAIELFETLYNIHPERFCGTIYLAGEAYHLSGNPEKALEMYNISPDEPCVLYNKGLALLQLKNTMDAAEIWIRGFIQNPHIAAILLNKKTELKGQARGFLRTVRYAEDFVGICGSLWSDTDILKSLDHIFSYQRVQDFIHSFDDMGNRTSPEGFSRHLNDSNKYFKELVDEFMNSYKIL